MYVYEQIKFKYIINILFFDVCNYVSMNVGIAAYIYIYIASMYVYVYVCIYSCTNLQVLHAETLSLIPRRRSIQPLGAAVPAGI